MCVRVCMYVFNTFHPPVDICIGFGIYDGTDS